MIIKENIQLTEGLEYHKENNIPLDENIYRFGSANYFKLYNEARKLYKEGKLKPIDELEEFFLSSDIGEIGIYEGEKVLLDFPMPIKEAEYKGKTVQLNKPKRGGSKKFYVYVKDGDKVKKVSFGAKGGGGKLSVKLKDPKARKAFSDRHNCPDKKDRTSAGYWSCALPRYAKQLGLSGGGRFW